ncbi:MAG: hypothetical protein FWG20_02140 [Candidatus Cloacimonetes bacterium]|nr:hypothetical protein [Candidatus Cloacimonadota bacterium]
MGYEFKDWYLLMQDFREEFKVEFSEFYNKELTDVLRSGGNIYIDLVKFNDYLIMTHGQQYKTKSIKELVMEKYGFRALEILIELVDYNSKEDN